MYISVIWMPIGQTFFALAKNVLGPAKTLSLSHKLSQSIQTFVKLRDKELSPDDLKWELRLISHLTPHRWAACFETACAFDVWLAFHGQKARICIGKRLQNGRLQMHAWIECRTTQFFNASGFEEVFSAAEVTDESNRIRHKTCPVTHNS